MSEYTPSMDMIRRAYVSVNGARAVYSRAADDDRALVGRNFDRAIAAHDAEVILEYVKRAKPGPIHIDNIDGVKAGDWFRARDAATREAVLVEVAEWLESFGHYDNIADQVRYLYPHTPQGRAGEGHRATQSAPAGDWASEDLTPLLAAHDGFVKVAAKMTMTTTEMAARNTKARKEAHDLDVAHAVALERAAIISHLQRRQSKHYAEFDKWGDPSEQERGIAYDMAWQEVQNGAHNRGAGE